MSRHAGNTRRRMSPSARRREDERRAAENAPTSRGVKRREQGTWQPPAPDSAFNVPSLTGGTEEEN
ncbi:MAG: hypothetical protein JWM85_2117 [Acidimicrobiaceae bacterium]|nr:hypothetical protein [Acidimicrobiaceae bacterium]